MQHLVIISTDGQQKQILTALRAKVLMKIVHNVLIEDIFPFGIGLKTQQQLF
jgi:hypothetical protein